ncbi:MAG: mechanosensitive ion channel family protein [Chloroflexi bacterium]|nr:MAG: mechanosensitive ion channel family protein [Chloroflexota bacterium]
MINVGLVMDEIFTITWLESSGIRILIIIAIAVASYLVLRHFIPLLIKRTVALRMKGELEEEIKKRSDTLCSLLTKIALGIIVILALVTILPEFGINITGMLVGLGIVGIAVGFGAQSLIRDYLSGIFILLEDQYDVGDVVRVAGIAGLVEEVGLRRTVLRDLDGIVHSVSNGEIKTASNFTKGYSRVNLNISVAYGEDLDRVIKVINRVCKEMAEEPKWKADFITTPQVLRVNNLGDSGIDIKILGDTKPIKQWAVMGELRLRLKRTFDAEGIEIPWPHTKVYFGNAIPEMEAAKQPSRKSTATKKSKKTS